MLIFGKKNVGDKIIFFYEFSDNGDIILYIEWLSNGYLDRSLKVHYRIIVLNMYTRTPQNGQSSEAIRYSMFLPVSRRCRAIYESPAIELLLINVVYGNA